MDSYFKNFDYIQYDYTIRGETPIIETVVDLMHRVQLKVAEEDLARMCDEYVVPSGMKPEQIASSLYNDPYLHWVIMYVNDITDIHGEWPITENALADFVTKKYGARKEYDTHHYEKMPERLWIDPAFCLSVYGETARLVTNYEYEYELNEVKRHIRVIKPSYVSTFVQAFQKASVNNG